MILFSYTGTIGGVYCLALSVVILACSIVVLTPFIPRSRYGLPFFLLTLGISISLISVLLQNYNFSTYSPPDYMPLRDLDMLLYRFICQYRVPMVVMQRIRMLGCLIYQYGILLLTHSIAQNIMLGTPARHRRLIRAAWALMLVLPIVIMLFYSTDSAYRIYLTGYNLPATLRPAYHTVIHYVDVLFHLLVLAYILVPFVLLLAAYRRKRVTYFIDTMITLLFLVAAFDFVFYFYFFFGPYNLECRHALKSGFWYFSDLSRTQNLRNYIFPFFASLTTSIVIININRFFNSELIFNYRKKALTRNIHELNQNLKEVFHSEKNLMFSINILVQEIREQYGTPAGLQKLDRLGEIADNRINSITNALNRIR